MATQIPLASGGEVSYINIDNNSYWVVHKFTSSGEFKKTTSATINGYYLIVGGGGAGGGGGRMGGGGGAGGFLTNWGGSAVTLADSGVIVGAGGIAYHDASGSNGGNSSYNGIVAYGGGGGGVNLMAGVQGASVGGSGGRTGMSLEPYMPDPIQGNRGGTNHGDDGVNHSSGGGGGGAGGAGGNAFGGEADNACGGYGGHGIECYILDDQSHWYAAGGSGGSNNSSWRTPSQDGIGGMGGGRYLSGTDYPATAGAANTGSGGGGNGYDNPTDSGHGGSGIVILRYLVTRWQVSKTATTNGTINNTTTAWSDWVTSGENISFAIKPNANYRISSITVNGSNQSISAAEMNSGKTLNLTPSSNTTVGANFTLKPYVTVSPSSGGSVNRASGYYNYNQTTNFVVKAASGYTIKQIKVGNNVIARTSLYEQTVPITPTANIALSVTFAADVDVSVNITGKGTVNPGSGKVAYGQEHQYVVTPQKRNIIKSIKINGVSQTISKDNKNGKTISITPTAATTIDVVFKPKTNNGEMLMMLME